MPSTTATTEIFRSSGLAANEAGLDLEITVIKFFKQYEPVRGRD